MEKEREDVAHEKEKEPMSQTYGCKLPLAAPSLWPRLLHADQDEDEQAHQAAGPQQTRSSMVAHHVYDYAPKDEQCKCHSMVFST